MKATDIDSMKSAWKKEQGFEKLTLSQGDIEKFLHSRSKDITQLFKKGLIFDVVLKTIVGASLIGIIVLLPENRQFDLSMMAILLFILWAIWFQVKMYRRIPQSGMSEPAIRSSLEKKIQFYHQHFLKSLYIGALTNSLILISGSLYYFYFKYGEIRPLDLDDYLVSGTAIILAFVFGAIVQLAQHNFQIKQLESCLQEIDEDTMTEFTLKQQGMRKRRLFFMALTAIVCGLLLLAYFVFR